MTIIANFQYSNYKQVSTVEKLKRTAELITVIGFKYKRIPKITCVDMFCSKNVRMMITSAKLPRVHIVSHCLNTITNTT